MSGGAWFRQAVELAWRHPKVLLPWIPVLGLSIFANFLSRSPRSEVWAAIVEVVLWFGPFAWAQATTLFFLEVVARGEAPSLDTAAGRGLGRTPQVIGLQLVLTLLPSASFAVPGALAYAFLHNSPEAMIPVALVLFLGLVFLLLRLSLTVAALVLGEMKIGPSITESWSLTRLAFAHVLWLFVLVKFVVGLGLLFGLIPGIGPVFSGLGMTVGSYLATGGAGYAYLELRSVAAAESSPTTPPREGGSPT